METIDVSGVWIRKRGMGAEACVEVLSEVGGEWRLIYRQKVERFTDGEVSHVVEPLGIAGSKPDDLPEG